jgi:glycogen debranching enzyme
LSNLQQGHDGRFGQEGYDYRYVCPSLHKYRWQWYWDSCFHAIALAHLEPDLAKAELESLLAAQDPDGFVGHVTYWRGAARFPVSRQLEGRFALRPRHSALIQPPLVAQAVERVFDVTGDREFLGRVYDKLSAHYRWLGENRCPDGDGLIALISPFESGMDNTPAYDSALGVRGPRPGWWAVRLRVAGLHVGHLALGRNYDFPTIYGRAKFNVKDVAVNCIYAEALRAMVRMATELHQAQDAENWRTEATRVETAIITNNYEEAAGAFFPTYGPERRTSRVLTVAALFPLLLESLPSHMAEEIVNRHLIDPEIFWPEYPLPTVAMSEPSFDADPGEGKHPLIWRGPT